MSWLTVGAYQGRDLTASLPLTEKASVSAFNNWRDLSINLLYIKAYLIAFLLVHS